MSPRDAYAATVCRPRIRFGAKALTLLCWVASGVLWWFAVDYLPRHWKEVSALWGGS